MTRIALLGSIVTALALLRCAALLGTAAPSTAGSGPVAWWKLDGSFKDSAGSDDGRPKGRLVLLPGAAGGGVLFAGDSAVLAPDMPSLAVSGSLTLSARVKVDAASPGAVHMILFRGDSRPGLDPYYLAALPGPPGGALIEFHVEDAELPPKGGAREIKAPVPLGEKVEVVATLDAATGSMRLYLNGRLAAQAETQGRPMARLDPGSRPGIGIGNSQDPSVSNQPFDGVIQDVRIYNRALSAAEIGALGRTAPAAPPQPPSPLPSYWPRFQRPTKYLTADVPKDPDEYTTLETLQGLVAQACNAGRTHAMIWLLNPGAYDLWFAAMLRQTGARAEGPFTTAQLLRRYFREGVVRGYILYHPDTSSRSPFDGSPGDASVNVATSLCGPMDAVAIADKSEGAARGLGLPMLLDARGISEDDCFDRYRDLFNRNVVCMEDPKVGNIRSEAVAMRAFVVAGPGALYDRALAWAHPDCPVLGWGPGDEWAMTSHATRQGLFMTDTNWCLNLPDLSTATAGKTLPAAKLRPPQQPPIWDLKWEDNVSYATFIMSDGDNVQWLMGGFYDEPSWWNSPYRGKTPMGWTLCYDNLEQLCPYDLEHLFRTATSNDDFILYMGGYYYPDLFGVSRPHPDAVLARHARDVTAAMKMGRVRMLMFNNAEWDSPRALWSNAIFASDDPALLGIFSHSYDPYTAGRGGMHWVPDGYGGEAPVVSIRYAVWNHSGDYSQGDPAKVAAFLNGAAHRGPPDNPDRFSAVMIHCWSWFAAPHDGRPAGEVDQNLGGKPGTGRGMAPAVWTAELLEPHVRLLKPTEFLEMLRLRLHPAPTLKAALATLRARLTRSAATRKVGSRTAAQTSDGFHQSQSALEAAQTDLDAGRYRQAFLMGQKIYRGTLPSLAAPP